MAVTLDVSGNRWSSLDKKKVPAAINVTVPERRKVMHSMFTLCSQPVVGSKDYIVHTIFTLCLWPMAGAKNPIVTNLGLWLLSFPRLCHCSET